MREATGGSFLLYLVLFFVGVIILFFASIMSYSKAYKVKNRIINVIEEYGDIASMSNVERDNIIALINDDLSKVGYSYTQNRNTCNFNNCNSVDDINNTNYNYCLCKVDVDSSDSSKGYFYEVITFTEFRFPIIDSIITSNVHGETKIMGKSYDDY